MFSELRTRSFSDMNRLPYLGRVQIQTFQLNAKAVRMRTDASTTLSNRDVNVIANCADKLNERTNSQPQRQLG